MFSGFSANQTFNILLAMSLAALATVASLELHSQPIEVSKLVQGAAELLAAQKGAADEERDSSASTVAVAREASEPEGAAMAQAAATDAEATNSIPLPPPPAPARVAELAPMHAPYAPRKPDAAATPINVSALNATTHTSVPSAAAVRVPIAWAANKTAAAPAAPAAASGTTLAALPAKPGVIFEDAGRKVCIGGTACEAQCKIEAGGCEVKPVYTIKLDQPAYIAAVQLYAHDQVGPSRRSELFVKVNGEPIGKTEVHRYGSTRTIKIGREGQLVTIESRHQHNGFLLGGEEAVLWDVYLIGREPH